MSNAPASSRALHLIPVVSSRFRSSTGSYSVKHSRCPGSDFVQLRGPELRTRDGLKVLFHHTVPAQLHWLRVGRCGPTVKAPCVCCEHHMYPDMFPTKGEQMFSHCQTKYDVTSSVTDTVQSREPLERPVVKDQSKPVQFVVFRRLPLHEQLRS